MLSIRGSLLFIAALALAGCGGDVVRPSGDAGADAPPTDAPIPGDAPRTCITSADCRAGEECGAHEGCDTPSYCGPALGRPCTADLAPYCGCDGVTFYASSTCPTRSYQHRGPCEIIDAGPPPGCDLGDGRVCPRGQSCPSPDGCNICFCDSTGMLACTGRACVDAGPPEDVPVPRSCRSTGDCPPSMLCDGPPGCDTIWTCVPVRGCTADLSPFCGCDGATFESSSTCVGRPYQHRGACSGASDGGVAPACAPQDASADGRCDLFLGYAWNGRTCVGLGGCRCVGADCPSLYRDMRQCLAAHAGCPATP